MRKHHPRQDESFRSRRPSVRASKAALGQTHTKRQTFSFVFEGRQQVAKSAPLRHFFFSRIRTSEITTEDILTYVDRSSWIVAPRHANKFVVWRCANLAQCQTVNLFACQTPNLGGVQKAHCHRQGNSQSSWPWDLPLKPKPLIFLLPLVCYIKCPFRCPLCTGLQGDFVHVERGQTTFTISVHVSLRVSILGPLVLSSKI